MVVFLSTLQLNSIRPVKNALKSDLYLSIRSKFSLLLSDGYIVIISLAIVYAISWSYISFNEFWSQNDYVFDLGIVLERSWAILHTAWTFNSAIREILYSGIVFILAPFFTAGGYYFILIFQSIAIGFTAIPLYYVSMHYLKGKLPSLLISASFLIYFPLAGLNWYDAHYQAFFLPLFVSGYALYLRKNYKLSIAFLALSGLTRYPYVIFPLLLSIWIVLESFFNRIFKGAGTGIQAKYYSVFGIFLLVQLLASYLLLQGSSGLSSDIHLQPAVSPLNYLFADLDSKIITVVFYLAPLLFLPLLSKKWIIFILPGFALIFLTTNVVYLYPLTFMKQYGAGIAPFLYLGAIEGLASITENQGLESKISAAGRRVWQNRTKVSVVLLITTMLFGSVFLPYGPYNSHVQTDYHLKSNLDPNMASFNELEKLVSLIPSNSSNVVIQNNIPQLLPRALQDGQILVPGLSIYYNMTYQTSSGHYHSLRPEYILSYPNGNWYKSISPYPFNISMEEIIQNLYSTGTYGILGEASNMLLLEKNYTGPIKYYVPSQNFISGNSFSPTSQSFLSGNAIRTKSNVSDSLAWFGPYTSLAPGMYNITADISSSSLYKMNKITISATSFFGADSLGSLTINGTELNSSGSLTSLSFLLKATTFEADVEFKGWISNWTGSLDFKGVKIEQLSNVPLSDKYNQLISSLPDNTTILTQRALVPLFNSDKVSTTQMPSFHSSAQYIVADSNMGGLYQVSSKRLFETVNEGIHNGSYGIYAEESGLIVLEKGFKGTPALYNNELSKYSPASFYYGPNVALSNSGARVNNVSHGLFWYGPYISLLPGAYNLTLGLNTSSLNSTNVIDFDITSNSGSNTILQTEFNGSMFGTSNTTEFFTIHFSAPGIENLVEFRGENCSWNGTLYMSGITLIQTSA